MMAACVVQQPKDPPAGCILSWCSLKEDIALGKTFGEPICGSSVAPLNFSHFFNIAVSEEKEGCFFFLWALVWVLCVCVTGKRGKWLLPFTYLLILVQLITFSVILLAWTNLYDVNKTCHSLE